MKIGYILILALACCSQAFSADKIPAWKVLRYEREVIRPHSMAPFGRIIFDEVIYANTRSTFPDFRILDQSRHEVPFIIKQRTVKSDHFIEDSVPAEILSFSRSKDSSIIEVIVKCKNLRAPVMGINIKTPVTDFDKQSDVYGSDDKKKWVLLKKGAKLFDFSSIIDLRNSKIKIPPSRYTYLKIVISGFVETKENSVYSMVTKSSNIGEASEEIKKSFSRREMRINAIYLMSRVKSFIPELREYPSIVNSIKQKDNMTEMDIAIQRCPVTSLIIITSSTNFSRAVTISSLSPDKKEEHSLSKGKVHAYRLPGVNNSSLSIRLPETRSMNYRIKIYNNDSPALKDIEIKAMGPVYQAEFIVSGNMPTKAYYGGNLSAAVYDINEVMMKAKKPQYCGFKLGQQTNNPDFSEKSIQKKDYKYLLWITIILAAVILIVVIAVNMKNFSEMEQE